MATKNTKISMITKGCLRFSTFVIFVISVALYFSVSLVALRGLPGERRAPAEFFEEVQDEHHSGW